jgi:ribosome biogenesis protein ERB1
LDEEKKKSRDQQSRNRIDIFAMAKMDAKASKKRKAVTRDVEEEAGVFSGDELAPENLDGALSDSANDLSESEEEDSDSEIELIDDFSSEDEEDEEPELDSDEIPSDTEGKEAKKTTKATDADHESNVRIVKDANGNERYLYDEINPDDNSDYSDVEENANTIGDIPLSFYDQYPHIGYDINGKKIMRPAKGEALDALLDSIEIPKGWTGLTDPSTGKPLELSQDELELLKKVQMNETTVDGYNPYEPTVEWFTSQQEIMPLSAAPEPKRRFVPSKHEQKRVMKLVKAIRDGRIQPYRPPEEREDKEDDLVNYDLWADEAERPDHIMHIPAPKLPPPGYEESYHPPPEYLPNSKERKEWEAMDPEDREQDYLPNDFGSLRRVPGYENFVQEKFERCLDLYLAPRVRRSKLNIDPESLLPKLPSPEELKPFPTTCATVFRGHKGRVRSLAVDPTGIWLATGGDDGTIRVWELLTGRQLWSAKLSDEDAVNVVRWRPGKDAIILAAAAGDDVFLTVPPIADPEIEKTSLEIIDAGWGYAASQPPPSAAEANKKSTPPQWIRPSSELADAGATTSSPSARAPQRPPPLRSPSTPSPSTSPNSPSDAVSRAVAPRRQRTSTPRSRFYSWPTSDRSADTISPASCWSRSFNPAHAGSPHSTSTPPHPAHRVVTTSSLARTIAASSGTIWTCLHAPTRPSATTARPSAPSSSTPVVGTRCSRTPVTTDLCRSSTAALRATCSAMLVSFPSRFSRATRSQPSWESWISTGILAKHGVSVPVLMERVGCGCNYLSWFLCMVLFCRRFVFSLYVCA